MCSPPDRPWGVLQGTLQGCQLQGLRQEPVCVMSLQGAGLLLVRLLRRPIADQHGQAKCWSASTTLPVRVRCHLCITQLHAGELRCNSELPPARPPVRGGGQVCVYTCVCFIHIYVMNCTFVLWNSKYFSMSVGSPSSLAMLPLPCTQCSI